MTSWPSLTRSRPCAHLARRGPVERRREALARHGQLVQRPQQRRDQLWLGRCHPLSPLFQEYRRQVLRRTSGGQAYRSNPERVPHASQRRPQRHGYLVEADVSAMSAAAVSTDTEVLVENYVKFWLR